MSLLDKFKKGKKDDEELEISYDEGYDDIENDDYNEDYSEDSVEDKGSSSQLIIPEDDNDGEFLSSEEKKELRENVTRKDVELDSEEQQQILEQEKMEELAEDMKYYDTKKPLNYTIFKILNTTPLLHLVLYYIIMVMINGIYLVLVTKNTVIALLLAMIMSVFLVNSFVIKRAEMRRYMNNLFQVSGYATTLVHYIKSGNSLTYAYNESWKSIEGDVKYDIRRTLNQMNKDATLDTESFKRYDSKSLIIFHRILEIWYLENSSNAGEMFSSVLRDLSMEVEKRNQLMESKNTKAITLYMMSATALAIPLITALMTGQNYDVFMSAVTSQYLVGVYYLAMVGTIIKINNSTTEAKI